MVERHRGLGVEVSGVAGPGTGAVAPEPGWQSGLLPHKSRRGRQGAVQTLLTCFFL